MSHHQASEGKNGALSSRAYELALANERDYHGCCQCVLAAVQDTMGNRDDTLFRAGSGLAGGMGLSGQEACGALVGSVLAISQLCGRERDEFDDPEGKRRVSYAYTRLMRKRFFDEYNATTCREILRAMHGRYFDLLDPADWAEFMKQGGHSTTCPRVAGNAARWAVEIILDNPQDFPQVKSR